MFDWLDFPLRLGIREFWFITVTARLMALISFITGFLWFRRALVIEDAPTSTICPAAQGYVELQGEAMVMDGALIVAPLSFAPCAWYRYRVDEKIDNGGGQKNLGNRWHTIDSGISDGLFLIAGRYRQLCYRSRRGDSVAGRDPGMVRGQSHTSPWTGSIVPVVMDQHLPLPRRTYSCR